MDETVPILGHEKRMLGRMLLHAQGADAAGEWIGPYCLIECIGEGGFGMVWRAEQEEPVRREVALKVIKLGMDTVQVLGRFHLERQTLASLEHPHIATMLDAGASADGRPYFAMELVHGMPITQWCQNHATTLEVRLRLFHEVCLAVHHAHQRGILHRDLKPSNVLMTKIDGQPVPKVIDFGIAKALHADRLEDFSALTQGEQILGTPLYMSPEQIEGGRTLDARSDVYALGVLLYELLTTETPFDLSTVEERGLSAIQHLILETVPERPSVRLRRNLGNRATTKTLRRREELSADLDWITMRALEKDRLRRYQTAAEFAADVQRYLESKPILARPPSVAYVSSRWFKRHRRGTLAAAIGAALTALVLVAAGWYAAGQAKKPRAVVLAQDGTFTNDLGMKFVDVPGTDVLMCIHETRHKDYEAYAAEVPGAVAIWSNGVERGLDPMLPDRGNHPVIRVSWEEAQSFCTWLSKKEHRVYRLPTDREWSYAVGLGDEEKWTTETTPAGISKNTVTYPWGTTWPPPKGVGNFSDEARNHKAPTPEGYLLGYDDGFFTTAPVMSFRPNKLGLYDLSGNVNEWVEDWWDEQRKSHALRGGSWEDVSKDKLLSSARVTGIYAVMHPAAGFRCVLERRPTFHASPPVIQDKPRLPKFPKTMKPAELAKANVTNSLGMQFVPVPGTDVLFCLHETRRKDYVAFDHEVPQTGAGLQWKQQHWGDEPTGMGEAHPVSGVNWHEAQDFCAWLSKKEDRIYRLPTDAEWSIAVGIGELESQTRNSTPDMLAAMGPTSFPYGPIYPPTSDQHAGNYADLTHRRAFPTADILEKYDDGFVTSAPVMSFKPNPLGLYDLGGNVSEWTESWTNARQSHKVLRGGSWEDFTIDGLHAGKRFPVLPVIHRATYGFRCVLESDLPDPNLPPPRKFPEPLPEAEVQARSVTNSLGMKFVPVPGADVLFCIHETRRQDFATYASCFDIDQHPEVSCIWTVQQKEGWPVGAEDNHPVTAVTWDDANAFCAWLGRREDRLYRLPTDREWSIAVGLGPYEATNQPLEQLSKAGGKEFPFGNVFPPRGKAGNYADEAFRRTFLTSPAIRGFDDGFATTAPVMSFKPNPFGLYDLGGNVVEWCDDTSTSQDTMRVHRGGSWISVAEGELYSAKRSAEVRSARQNRFGFRCVLVPGGKPPPLTDKDPHEPAGPLAPISPAHAAAVSALQAQSPPRFLESMTLAEAEQQAVTNSLGMKLLPVAGTSVLFCIHETRYKDYAAYASLVPVANEPWKSVKVDGVVNDDQQNHPVFSVSWQEAQAFCAWLSQKEGRTYRLPTDREWSCAVGIGPREPWKKDTTPQTVFKVPNHYPWEGAWPPPAGAGNLLDETRHAKVPLRSTTYIEGYEDGFATTAPVMKFKPSSRGLYDMAGNVWEWCEDAYDHDHRNFPTRGGSWALPGAGWTQSSFRYPRLYNTHSPTIGFRIVLEP